MLYAYDMILESLLAMIGSLVLSYQFLVTKWNAPESFSFLNSAWINVLLIVVVVFLSWISQKFNAKEFEIWNKIAEQGKFGNRVFTFYCWEMKDKSRMLDTRMYRQYNIASDMTNECGIFNPGGFFDKIMSTEGVTYKILSCIVQDKHSLCRTYDGLFAQKIGILQWKFDYGKKIRQKIRSRIQKCQLQISWN